MPKGRKSKKAMNSRMDFHQALVTNTSAANIWNLQLYPQVLPTRVATQSDVWSLFRITRFRFRIKAATLLAVAGVVTSRPNTLPNTQADIGELLDSVPDLGALTFAWSSWVTVSSATLHGPFDWYHTRPGTYDITEYVPATLCGWTSGATDVTYLEFEGSIEFRDPVAQANTPLLSELRLRIRELEQEAAEKQAREKFVKLIGGPTLK